MAIVTVGSHRHLAASGIELLAHYWGRSTTSEIYLSDMEGNSTFITGTGFVASDLDTPFQGIVTGTVSSFKASVGGNFTAEVSGLNVHLGTLIEAAENDALFEFLLKDADTVTGTAGSDILAGFGGNDTIDAGVGTLDVAVFRGNLSDYTITKNPDGSLQVLDKRDASLESFDGVDMLKGVEFLKFDNGLYTTALKVAKNTAPIITKGQIFGVEENGQVKGQLDGFDLLNDTLVWHLAGKPLPGLRLTADGEFTFTANGAAYDALKEGQVMKVTFKAQATTEDGRVGKAQSVTLNVTGKNDAVDAVNDTATVGGKALAIKVLKNDLDLDKGDTKTLVGTTTGTFGPATIVGGTVKYGVDGKILKIGTGQSLTDSFTYTVQDGSGAQDTATVNVTLNGLPTSAKATAAVPLTLGKSDLVTIDLTTLKNVAFDAANKLKPVTALNGFTTAQDKIVFVNGDTHFQATAAIDYAGLTTLKEMADKAASLVAGGTATAFAVGTNAYLYVDQNDNNLFDATDGLLKLTGVDAWNLQGTTVGTHVSLILI